MPRLVVAREGKVGEAEILGSEDYLHAFPLRLRAGAATVAH